MSNQFHIFNIMYLIVHNYQGFELHHKFKNCITNKKNAKSQKKTRMLSDLNFGHCSHISLNVQYQCFGFFFEHLLSSFEFICQQYIVITLLRQFHQYKENNLLLTCTLYFVYFFFFLFSLSFRADSFRTFGTFHFLLFTLKYKIARNSL